MGALIYLDTNVVLWLAPAPEQLSDTAAQTLELEIEYLYEVGRVQQPATAVLEHLRAALNLQICARSFASVVAAARPIRWTRDPFDRLITAQASLAEDTLLTRDKIIRANYAHAVW